MKKIRYIFSDLLSNEISVMVILISLSVVSGVLSYLTNRLLALEWWSSLLQNISTDMFGAFLTFWLLEIIVGTRQEKYKLIHDLGSSVNAIAKRASEELFGKGWHATGALRNVNLSGANLQGVKLQKADFQESSFLVSDLSMANLEGSDLQKVNASGANMQGIILSRSNMSGAMLTGANLSGANLLDVNLQGADLFNANLDNTYLVGANLRGANLHKATMKGCRLNDMQGQVIFDENTTLPDGSKWAKNRQLEIFM